MAVAPVGAVRRVVEFALTQMDAAKILLGFPNYAYDWTLPFTAGATRAQSIGNEAAPLLAVSALLFWQDKCRRKYRYHRKTLMPL